MPTTITAKESPEQDSSLLRVFVSYSRRDSEQVIRIVDALEACGIDVLIDKRDLPLATEFKDELREFIRRSDTVVYIVSSASINSKWCRWELEEVRRQGKRLAPIVIEKVNVEIPDDIRKINYVSIVGKDQSPGELEGLMSELSKALAVDLAWVKEHTRFGELAHRWSTRDHSSALLLRGTELQGAIEWLTRGGADHPPVTDRQRAYIEASRNSVAKRRNLLVVLSLLVAVLATGLAIFAFGQRNTAQANERRSVQNEIRALVELARGKVSQGDSTAAFELALEAFDKGRDIELPLENVETVLYEALWRNREIRRRDLRFEAKGAWFTQDGRILVDGSDGSAVYFDASLREIGREPAPKISPGEEKVDRRPKPVPVPFERNPGGEVVTFSLPTPAGSPPRRIEVKQTDLLFEPYRAWTGRGFRDRRLIFVEGRDMTKGLMQISEDGAVTKIDSKGKHQFEIDPDGGTILFWTPYGEAFVIRVGRPDLPVLLTSYVVIAPGEASHGPGSNLFAYVEDDIVGGLSQIALIDLEWRMRFATLGGHESAIASVDFSPDSEKIVTLTKEGVLRLWSSKPEAEAGLVQQFGGTILPGPFASDPDPEPKLPLPTEPWYLNKIVATALGLGSSPFDAYYVPEIELVIVADGTGFSGHSATELTNKLFSIKTEEPIEDVLHHEGIDVFVTIDKAGKVIRYSTSGKREAELFGGDGTAVLHADFDPDEGQKLHLITKKGLYRVKVDSGSAVHVHDLGLSPEISSLKVRDFKIGSGFVSFAGDLDGVGWAGYVYSHDGALIAIVPDAEELTYDPQLEIAYGNLAQDGGVPLIVDVSSGGKILNFFPEETLGQSLGLSSVANMELTRVPGKRRVYLNLGGGVPDLPWRGEGVLVDLQDGREIARDRGDPDILYYGGGEGLPVFPDEEALADYVRELLVSIGANAQG